MDVDSIALSQDFVSILEASFHVETQQVAWM
jgi:hypothetical protein